MAGRKNNSGGVMTYEQAEARKDRGVEGLRNMGNEAAADDLEEEDVEDFAARKHITIVNPRNAQPPSANRRNAYRGKRRNFLPGSVRYDAANLTRRNKAIEWMQEHQGEYSTARELAQDASTKYDFPVADLIGEAHKLFKQPNRRRRNPDTVEDAAAMSEKFHGRPAGTITEIKKRQSYRRNLAGMGELLCLRTDLTEQYFGKGYGFCWDEGDGVIACCDAEGNQIYFEGGSQDVTPLMEMAGWDTSKDLLDLGECSYIEYLTDKVFDNFEPKIYCHQFGEETGECPRLVMDKLNKQLYLVGGAYEARPEGIVN